MRSYLRLVLPVVLMWSHLAVAAGEVHLRRLRAEIQARGFTVAVVALRDPAARQGVPVATGARLEEVRAIERRFFDGLDPAHVQVRARYRTFAGAVVRVDAEGLARLAAAPEVVALEEDLPSRAALAESVPLIRGTQAHAEGRRGGGVGVAVLDSGINAAHLDLAPALLGNGYHFLSQGADQGAGGTNDTGGHGTNVAGVIASRGQVASLGVAPEASLYIVKVLDENGGWASDWSLAVDHVTAHRNDFPGAPLRVINMSLGTFSSTESCSCDGEMNVFATAVSAARAAGIAVIVASGNSGLVGSLPAPACFSAALAVGATYDSSFGRSPDVGTYKEKFGGEFADCADQSAPRSLACFTNRNACVKLVAPGSSILGPYVGGPTALGSFNGTSQATPHVAGVAAQLAAAHPAMSADQIYAALLSSSQLRVDDPDRAGASYAFLDAVDAERAATACSPACTATDVCDVATCESGSCVHRPASSGCGECTTDDQCSSGQLCQNARCVGITGTRCNVAVGQRAPLPAGLALAAAVVVSLLAIRRRRRGRGRGAA